MNETALAAVAAACESFYAGRDGSHSFDHARRVAATAASLARELGLPPADAFVVGAAAYAHDVADYKYARADAGGAVQSEGDAVRAVLRAAGVGDADTLEAVVYCVERVGYHAELAGGSGDGSVSGGSGSGTGGRGSGSGSGGSGGDARARLDTLAAVVQDADRLDAIGAVGIARAFSFGGARARALYDDPLEIVTSRDAARAPSAAAYVANSSARAGGAGASTVAHFHDKLLRLSSMMKTDPGRRLAAGRHKVLESFLEQLAAEVKGER